MFADGQEKTQEVGIRGVRGHQLRSSRRMRWLSGAFEAEYQSKLALGNNRKTEKEQKLILHIDVCS